MNELTISGMNRILTALHPLEHSLVLEWGLVRIRVKTNSPELVEKLRRYFREFHADTGADVPLLEIIAIQSMENPELTMNTMFRIRQPDPGKTKIKEEYADVPDGRLVRKRLTGMLFGFGNGNNIAVGNCISNDNQVINFINNRYMELLLNRDYILGHAAAVCLNDRGLAIAGFAGAGKSTLALHAMARGLGYVSNDRLLVRKAGSGLWMSGVAKLPRVNPGTILNHPLLCDMLNETEKSDYLRLSPTELWNLEHKYDVFIEETFGPNRVKLSSPMNGLVILNWNRSGEPLQILQVNPKQAPDLVGAFMKSPGLFYEPAPGRAAELDFHLVADHLDRIPVFELRGGADFDQAADFCARFLIGSQDEQVPDVPTDRNA